MAFIENALGIGPAQQAQTQQAQQNYAQGVSADASQLAQQQQQQALANMFLRYQQYMATNPNPAQTWKPIQQPGMNTGSVSSGGMIPSQGYGSTGAQPQTPASMMQAPPSMPSMPRNGGVPAANAAAQQPQNIAAMLTAITGSPRYLQGMSGGAPMTGALA